MRKMLVVAACATLVALLVRPAIRGLHWCTEAYKQDARKNEEYARTQVLGENELRIVNRGPFVHDSHVRLAWREAMVFGENEAGVYVEVRVSSVDNITVEHRTDGKDFPTIKPTGLVNGVADGAVILVPADDPNGYYEKVRREVHAEHSSYENCPKCHPGKK